MFAIVSYYLIVFLTLYGMRDEIFVNQMECLKNRFRNHKGIAVLLFIYPFILQPFCDVSICHVTAVIAEKSMKDFFIGGKPGDYSKRKRFHGCQKIYLTALESFSFARVYRIVFDIP